MGTTTRNSTQTHIKVYQFGSDFKFDQLVQPNGLGFRHGVTEQEEKSILETLRQC